MVDPLPDLRPYREALDTLGLQLDFVIDTHVHADHLSGSRQLARETGAVHVMHEAAPVRFPIRRVEDGEAIRMGNVVMTVWHTPGHTPEHLSLVVADHRRSPEPWCVLTGHSLMIGDAGRPDLAPGESARALYDTLFHRLMTLPDHVEVYPGAFAGST